MKTVRYTLAAIALLLSIPLVSTAQDSPTLTFLWETDTLLTTVESVIYDPASDAIYTTNIDGHFMHKDGQGSISKVALDGRIIDAEWISGLNAPTGTGIHNGRLYVTDIDVLVEIDIEAGKVLHMYAIDGARALNDIEVGPDGVVYASDTGGNAIYALRDGAIETIVTNTDTPNGLLAQDGHLLITRWTPQSVDHLNLDTKALTPLASGIEGPDGLEALGDGSYLASGFNGLIYHVAASGEKTLLLDTTDQGIRAADIDYVASKRLLLVPTMQSNKVMAYRLDG